MQDNPMECFTRYVSNNHGIVDIVEMVPISYHLLSFLQAVWVDSICEFANIQYSRTPRKRTPPGPNYAVRLREVSAYERSCIQ